MKQTHLTIYSLCCAIAFSILPIQASYAKSDKLQIIRFYKLNSKGQQNRLLIRESRLKKTGCHNFATKPKVYRLTQIGFEYCTVYAKKSCAAGSEITGLWKGEKEDAKLSQGGEWLFTHHDPEGIKAKSWSCQ